MTASYEKLARCFSAAFPGITNGEIANIDVAQLVGADSLAGVTLLALIDEEFGVDLDMAVLLELGSLASIAQYLDGRNTASAPSGSYK